jgi:hypothetical protein
MKTENAVLGFSHAILLFDDLAPNAIRAESRPYDLYGIHHLLEGSLE